MTEQEKTTMLAPFDEVVAEIEKYKALNEKLAFDYEDEKGNKDARSHVYGLRRIKGRIAEIHKVTKADVLKISREIDARKKELTDPVEEMIYFHNKHIKEIEQREEKAQAEMIRKAQKEKEAEDAKRLADIEAREKEIADKEAAIKAKEDEASRIEREKQVAEEARLAAEKEAKVQLEKAEQKRLADIEAAKVAKLEAEEEFKRQLEAAEQKRIADLKATEEKAKQEQIDRDNARIAEENRLADIESKRQANVSHCKKINKEVVGIFIEYMMPREEAERLIQGLERDSFPALSINY